MWSLRSLVDWFASFWLIKYFGRRGRNTTAVPFVYPYDGRNLIFLEE